MVVLFTIVKNLLDNLLIMMLLLIQLGDMNSLANNRCVLNQLSGQLLYIGVLHAKSVHQPENNKKNRWLQSFNSKIQYIKMQLGPSYFPTFMSKDIRMKRLSQRYIKMDCSRTIYMQLKIWTTY
jgi:hypothetical protein